MGSAMPACSISMGAEFAACRGRGRTLDVHHAAQRPLARSSTCISGNGPFAGNRVLYGDAFRCIANSSRTPRNGFQKIIQKIRMPDRRRSQAGGRERVCTRRRVDGARSHRRLPEQHRRQRPRCAPVMEDFVVAGHDNDRAEFEPFRKVHDADRHASFLGLGLLTEFDLARAGDLHRGFRPFEFGV